MTRLNNIAFLYIIIVLEGYIILSAELLAIRQTIPFVGSGTDTVSIIIAAVLMPLAFGYHAGGRYRLKSASGRYRTIRRKLLRNIIIAALFFLPALSYFFFQFFFYGLDIVGIENTVAKTTIYCLLFIVTPMYLLGQTIPLVSNYFSKEKLSLNTGRMLFASTMGSFAGSLFTTLVLILKMCASAVVDTKRKAVWKCRWMEANGRAFASTNGETRRHTLCVDSSDIKVNYQGTNPEM